MLDALHSSGFVTSASCAAPPRVAPPPAIFKAFHLLINRPFDFFRPCGHPAPTCELHHCPLIRANNAGLGCDSPVGRSPPTRGQKMRECLVVAIVRALSNRTSDWSGTSVAQVVFPPELPSVCQPEGEPLRLNEEITPADVFARCLIAPLPVCDEPHKFFTNSSR